MLEAEMHPEDELGNPLAYFRSNVTVRHIQNERTTL